MRIYTSPSRIVAADSCWRQYWYKYVVKWRTEVQSANLAFGSAIDVAVRHFLLAVAVGKSPPNIVDVFLKEWSQRSQNPLDYSSTQSPEHFEQMGRQLAAAFPSAWEASGFTVAVDINGRPLVDVDLPYKVGMIGNDELWMNNKLDLAVYTERGQLAVIDVKTAISVHTHRFTRVSEQLTSYQVSLDRHADELGLPNVEKLGFFDLLKRSSATATAKVAHLVPRRSSAEVKEFLEKALWQSSLARTTRCYPRQPRMQFNSPCEMCDFAQHCIEGSTENLIVPQSGATALA